MLFSVCSLSLACDLSTLYCFCFGCFSFGPTHPPLFLTFPACVFSLYLLLILLLFHLFSGGRDDYADRARCFKCHRLGHWARECAATWDSPRSAYRGTTFTPGYSYSSYTEPLSEPTVNPVHRAVMFLMTRLLISRRYIATVICLSLSLVLVRRA